MSRFRLILATPFVLLGLALTYVGALIGGGRMAAIILDAMKRNLEGK